MCTHTCTERERERERERHLLLCSRPARPNIQGAGGAVIGPQYFTMAIMCLSEGEGRERRNEGGKEGGREGGPDTGL